MSEAKALLDSLTDAELAEYSTEPVNDVLTIDAEKRTIDVPGTELLLGVITDKDVERKYFKCPRIVGDNIDLSKLSLRIPFINANNETDAYIVEDLAVVGEYITFSWLLSEKVLTYKGEVQFAVCAVKALDDGTLKNVWNTTMATGTVLNGIPAINIESEEEDQVRDVITQLLAIVENQKDEAIVEIEEVAAQIISTIPEDYQTTYKLVRSKANAIEGLETGEAISVSDASDNELMGLRIFGKTTQAATPTPGAPQDLVNIENPTVGIYGENIIDWDSNVISSNKGLTASILEDGGIRVVGTPESSYANVLFIQKKLYPGTYYISGGNETAGDVYAQATYKNQEGVTTYVINKSFTLTKTTDVNFYIQTTSYLDYVDVIIYPMLNIGSEKAKFTKYVGEQTLSVTTPNGLPGIPTTDESIATYRDENGILWIADEIDCERGVYIKRSKKFDLGSISNWTHQTSWSDANAFFAASAIPDAIAVSGYTTKASIMCNRLYTSQPNSIANSEKNAIAQGGDGNSIYVSIDGITDVTSLKTYLTNNETYIMYPLATPIETELSTAEIRAYQKLHTNKPNTTILNNAGATMRVNYGKDTKMYFDSLYNAIINGSEVEW